jgi:hypothetical protein
MKVQFFKSVTGWKKMKGDTEVTYLFLKFIESLRIEEVYEGL